MLMENAKRADEAMDVIAAGGGPARLVTAALPDAAGVRAEACERGSEPTRQSRGTAIHPRTLQVLTMTGAGGRRISDVLPAQGKVPDAHCAGMPDLPVVPLGGSAARAYGIHAGGSQLAAGQARRPKSAVQPAGTERDADRHQRHRLRRAQPVLAGPDEQHRAAGRRQPGLELAATRTVRPDSHATHSVTAIPAVN
jgi:hypothetical protein